jgi:histidinol phosphatase-like PHP family hydrolase
MNAISRRSFLGRTTATGAALALGTNLTAAAAGATDLPLVDYHVHVEGVITLEKAIEISRQRGVKFGVVEHAGTKANKYPNLLNCDADLRRYLDILAGKPVLRGIQAEGLDWMTCFSKELVAELDYVLTDALTFPEKDGRRVELWRPNVKIDDAEDFMDRYVDFHVQVLTREPIDILANLSFLPAQIADKFDALWTPARMKRIVDTAVQCNVAIEINSSMSLPRLPLLQMAKQAGAKFSFGSNIRGLDVGKLDYSIRMAKELGLKPADLFTPAPPGQKPIQRRRLAV